MEITRERIQEVAGFLGQNMAMGGANDPRFVASHVQSYLSKHGVPIVLKSDGDESLEARIDQNPRDDVEAQLKFADRTIRLAAKVYSRLSGSNRDGTPYLQTMFALLDPIEDLDVQYDFMDNLSQLMEWKYELLGPIDMLVPQLEKSVALAAQSNLDPAHYQNAVQRFINTFVSVGQEAERLRSTNKPAYYNRVRHFKGKLRKAHHAFDPQVEGEHAAQWDRAYFLDMAERSHNASTDYKRGKVVSAFEENLGGKVVGVRYEHKKRKVSIYTWDQDSDGRWRGEPQEWELGFGGRTNKATEEFALHLTDVARANDWGGQTYKFVTDQAANSFTRGRLSSK